MIQAPTSSHVQHTVAMHARTHARAPRCVLCCRGCLSTLRQPKDMVYTHTKSTLRQALSGTKQLALQRSGDGVLGNLAQ